MRKFASLTAAIILGLVASPSHALDLGPAWAGTDIQELGWTYLGQNEVEAAFIRQALGQGQFPKLWMRAEYQWETENMLSSEMLIEFNCREARYRIVSFTSFSGHNLSGGVGTTDTSTEWSYIAPGTFYEHMWTIACPTSPR